MNMNLYNVIVCHADNGITDRFKIGFEFCLILSGERFFRHYNKFSAIAEFNICFSLLIRFHHLCAWHCFD